MSTMNVYMLDDLLPRMCIFTYIMEYLNKAYDSILFMNGNRRLASHYGICEDWGFGTVITPEHLLDDNECVTLAECHLSRFLTKPEILCDIALDTNGLIFLDLELSPSDSDIFDAIELSTIGDLSSLHIDPTLLTSISSGSNRNLNIEMQTAIRTLGIMKSQLTHETYLEVVNSWHDLQKILARQDNNYPVASLLVCATGILGGYILITSGYRDKRMINFINNKLSAGSRIRDSFLPDNFARVGSHNLEWLKGVIRKCAESLEGLIPRERRRISDLDVSEWKSIRKIGREICAEFTKKTGGPLDHIFWLRHLPGGNPKQGHSAIELKCFEGLKKRMLSFHPVLKKCPDFEFKSLPEDNIPRWDLPPIRALVQFGCENDTKDIELLINLFILDIEAYLKGLPDGCKLVYETNISSLPKIAACNFLWFNVSALCRGLEAHLQSFCDHAFPSHSDDSGTAHKYHVAKVTWMFSEGSTDGEYRLEIAQFGTHDGNTAELVPLPAPSEARGKLASEVYKYLRKCGANIFPSPEGKWICTFNCEKAEIPCRCEKIAEIVGNNS